MLGRACSSSSEHMVASHSSSGRTRRRWDQPQQAVSGEMCHPAAWQGDIQPLWGTGEDTA